LPPGMVTELGTVTAFESELPNWMISPDAGAGLLICTPPVTAVVELPITFVGLTTILVNTGVSTTICCCWLLEPRVAVMVADESFARAKVDAVNFADVWSVVTLIVPGTVMELSVDDRATTTEPVLAFGEAFRITTPVDGAPP